MRCVIRKWRYLTTVVLLNTGTIYFRQTIEIIFLQNKNYLVLFFCWFGVVATCQISIIRLRIHFTCFCFLHIMVNRRLYSRLLKPGTRDPVFVVFGLSAVKKSYKHSFYTEYLYISGSRGVQPVRTPQRPQTYVFYA